MFAVIAKKIWARRNAVIHEDFFQHPNQLVREAKEMLFFGQASEGEVTMRSQNVAKLQVKWCPPPIGHYKLN